MLIIKRKILITVSYLVEAERDDFWREGYVHEPIKKSLSKRFPQRAKLTEDIRAKRIHLSHMIIDHPNSNFLTCPICKKPITDITKPNPIPTLMEAKELEGVLMCSSCAWQLEFDVKCGDSIESILERFKD